MYTDPTTSRIFNHPRDRIAIIDHADHAWTWGDVHDKARGMAAHFYHHGVRAGHRVFLAIDMNIERYTAILGLWYLGAVPVSIDPGMGHDAIRDAVQEQHPQAVILHRRHQWLALTNLAVRRIPIRLSPKTQDIDPPPMALPQAQDDALIQYTWGARRGHRAITRTHEYIATQAYNIDTIAGPCTEAACIDLIELPGFLLANLYRGGTTVLSNNSLHQPNRDTTAYTIARMERHHVTRVFIGPQTLRAMRVDSTLPAILGHVHTIVCGGDPVYPDTCAWFAAPHRLAPGGAGFINMYGAMNQDAITYIRGADISPTDWADMVEQTPARGIMVGKPTHGVQVRTTYQSIEVSADTIRTQYRHTPDRLEHTTDPDGRIWYKTGDAGEIDAQGNLWLWGRIQDKCYNQYPLAIESVALRWPHVERAVFLNHHGRAVLCVQITHGHKLPKEAKQADTLSRLSIQQIIPVYQMPMDPRNPARVDMGALITMINEQVHEPS